MEFGLSFARAVKPEHPGGLIFITVPRICPSKAGYKPALRPFQPHRRRGKDAPSA